MQKAKRISILIFLLLLLVYFSGTALIFFSRFYTIKEEVTYYTYNAGFIIELSFFFLLPIFVLLSIVYNLMLLKTQSNYPIENSKETLKIKRNKNTFLLNVYFIFSIVLIIHSLLKLYELYGLFEFRNEIGDFIYYLKIQAIVLLVLVSLGIIFLVDTIKLRKKHIKS